MHSVHISGDDTSIVRRHHWQTTEMCANLIPIVDFRFSPDNDQNLTNSCVPVCDCAYVVWNGNAHDTPYAGPAKGGGMNCDENTHRAANAIIIMSLCAKWGMRSNEIAVIASLARINMPKIHTPVSESNSRIGSQQCKQRKQRLHKINLQLIESVSRHI